MSDLCKNCGTAVSGKYCCNCGQPATTGRLDFHYIIHEIQHSIFHVDKGILYTIKELLIRPGSTIREYLLGKRISHFKPFAFVIILGTIYSFICYFLKIYPEEAITPSYSPDAYYYTQLTYDWVYGHYSFVMLALIPFYASGSYIMFRKGGYNYVEFLVACAYITGIQILILIITCFIYYLTLSKWAVLSSFLVGYLYHIWAYIQLFDNKSRISVILRTSLSIVLSFIFIMVIIFTGTVIFVSFYHCLRP
jgi:hypothetical protein